MNKIIGVILIGVPIAILAGGLISVYGLLNASAMLGFSIVMAAMFIIGVKFLSR